MELVTDVFSKGTYLCRPEFELVTHACRKGTYVLLVEARSRIELSQERFNPSSRKVYSACQAFLEHEPRWFMQNKLLQLPEGKSADPSTGFA